MSTSPRVFVKFAAVFCIYVAYVLFRRLPIAFLPQIRKEISLTNDDIGRIVSIHAAFFTISKLVFGTAADRTSNSRLIIGGVLVCATASICLAFSSEKWQMEVVMGFIGGVQGASWVPATKLVATWFDDSSYATMFSLLGCGANLSGMLLPLLKTRYWRAVHLNCGVLMVAIGLICQKWIITEDGLRKEVKPTKKSQLEAEAKQGVKAIVTSSVIWHIASVYFFSMEMRTICETWAPLYLTEKNVSADGFQLLYEIGGLVGIMMSGVLLDFFAVRIGVDPSRRITGIIFTCSMMLAAVGVFKYQELSSLFGFVTGFFVNGSINVWCLIGSQCGTKNIAGTVSTLISFVASMGAVFAGSPLAHLIHVYSYDIFTILLISQIVFVLSVSILRIPLRMTLETNVEDDAKDEKKKDK